MTDSTFDARTIPESYVFLRDVGRVPYGVHYRDDGAIADNGWIQLPNSSKYAPRSKREPYEGGTRTPIMVRWPGKITPRTDTQNLVSSIDLWRPRFLAPSACPYPPR